MTGTSTRQPSSASLSVSTEATIRPVSASVARCSTLQARRRLVPCFSTSHSPGPQSFSPVLSTSRCTGAAPRLGSRHLQRLGPAAQGAVVRHREIEIEQLQDGADQPLGLAQRQAEHGSQGQRRRDRQIGVGGLPAPAGARRCHPGRDCLRREPDRQAAAGAQAGVILGPVGHPVPLLGNVAATGRLGFERHGRGPSIREGAVVLHRPAPDANRPIHATRRRIVRPSQSLRQAR